MPESDEHKRLKDAGEDWMRTHRSCGWVIQEPDILGLRHLKQRPDVFGVVTLGSANQLWRTVEVEAEPSLPGIRAEMIKPYRLNPCLGIGAERWLLYPKGLCPDLDTLRVPVWFGLLECSTAGVVTVIREASVFNARDHRSELALLTSAHIKLENALGSIHDTTPSKCTGLGRSQPTGLGRVARGLAGEIAEVVERLATPEQPETHLTRIASELGRKRGEIAKVAGQRGGIPGLFYDRQARTLSLNPPDDAGGNPGVDRG